MFVLEVPRTLSCASLLLFCFSVGCTTLPAHRDCEQRAIQFLAREVPLWSKENGCFSCHNNGDGARALFLALKAGRAVPPRSLIDTLKFLRNPSDWDHTKGDPGFSDQRLADLQFANALAVAVRVKLASPSELSEAATRLLQNQQSDGSWSIEGQTSVGSPATYGPVLGTALAAEVLQATPTKEAQSAAQKARAWLAAFPNENISTVAAKAGSNSVQEVSPLIDYLLKTQTSDGGWGPYPNAPAEVFDTALVLLAFSRSPDSPGKREAIAKGRTFLLSSQEADGSWGATTRPSGGASYAQMISTTSWALIALLSTAAP